MTFGECLAPETLARYVRGDLGGLAAEDIRQHVHTCTRCADRAALLNRVWNVGAARIGDLLEEVEAIVARVLAQPVHRWPLIVREPENRRSDVARRLLAYAADERTRSSLRATAASEAAVVIADMLGAEARDAADLRFEALKCHSALLREAGRFAETRAVLVRAEEAAERTSDPELARGSILLSRALICSEPDIWEPEAGLALLDRADEIFTRRDNERLRRARIVRGMILIRQGEARAAKEIFEAVLAQTSASDESSYADALANAARANFDCGDVDRASELLTAAVTIDRQHGRGVNLAHDAVIQARIHGVRGEFDVMFEVASRAMRDFERLGLEHFAIRVGLLAIRALVAQDLLDDALELARSRAERSIALDVRAPAERHLRTAEAMSYLRELAQRRELTVDVVASIESYVDAISERPPFAFRPPVPLTTN